MSTSAFLQEGTVARRSSRWQRRDTARLTAPVRQRSVARASLEFRDYRGYEPGDDYCATSTGTPTLRAIN